MNLREGSRRLALLAGLIGLLIGCFYGWLQADDFYTQWRNHHQYQIYADSKAAKDCITAHRNLKPDAAGSTDLSVDYTKILNVGDSDGIRSITFEDASPEARIEYIDLTSGKAIQRVDAPSMWEPLAVIVSPFLGFLLPWVVVRALAWVVLGFTKQQ